MIKLLEAVRILAQADVAFVMVGGLAVRSHGSAYVTDDLDICYSRKRDNLKRITDALAPINPHPRGFPDELPYIWDWSTLQNGTNFTLRTSLCDIDLLGEVKGLGTYDDVLEQSILVEIDDVSVWILSIDGLIKAKETAGRPKDQAGLVELYALRDAVSED